MSAPTRTSNRPDSQAKTRLVRSVDALERLFYRYAERNPAHFCQVAEFDVTFTEKQVRTALSAIQRRHPLLSVHVEDRPSSRLGFYRTDSVAPIDLTVHESSRPWQSFATAELAHPFDRSTAPLMRAVLVNHRAGSTILLTFDHTIADGISSITVLSDLVDALNGKISAPRDVPAPLEDIVAQTLSCADTPRSDASCDPRMAEPRSIRPFDGTHPEIHTVALDTADTARLVDRCRAERTTVHAALIAAASRAHATLSDKEFVRVLSPINVRPMIGAVGDCVDYFTCTVTGMTPWDGTALWEQARAMTGELAIARSEAGVAATSSMIKQAVNVDAECAVPEQLFTQIMPFELMISNLGVQDLDAFGPIKPTALWGPVLQSQVDDHVIGVTTYDGRLRMVSTGYTPSDVYLETVKAALIQAAAQPRNSPS
ncbi:condensation domain-containing protein [Mycobacterium sp. NPDC048908]|uniref:condensation domain-containing protein n=1 Tax=Mycobacterium sp. NPDC048908 TaxID=3364292 RepID=UPI0037242E9E